MFDEHWEFRLGLLRQADQGLSRLAHRERLPVDVVSDLSHRVRMAVLRRFRTPDDVRVVPDIEAALYDIACRAIATLPRRRDIAGLLNEGLAALTKFEFRLLELVGQEFTVKEIALAVGMTTADVRRAIAGARAKIVNLYRRQKPA